MDIFEAIRARDFNAVKEIIDEGINLNLTDMTDCTPLTLALKYGEYKMAGLFVSNGADVNAVEEEAGLSALHYACVDRDVKGVSFLVNFGADVDLPNKDNFTPLMIACEFGSLEIVKTLLYNGANLNAQNNLGFTPLIYVTAFDHPEIVSFLLDAGVNAEMTTKKGLTAFRIAKRGELSEVIKAFEKHFSSKVS